MHVISSLTHFAFAHRVPDLQLDLLSLDVDHPGPELDPDGQVMHGLETFVGELKQQA